MPPYRFDVSCALTPIATLTLVAIGTICPAQDMIEVRPAPRPSIMIDENQFNMFAFGNNRPVQDLREDFNAQAEACINEIERDCSLSAEQVETLKFAARGDVERFFSHIDQKRDELIGKTVEQEKLNEVVQELQLLRNQFQNGFFTKDALLEKVAATVLDPEQASRREEALRERLAYRYRSNVDIFLVQMRTSLGLTEEQAERFEAALGEGPRLALPTPLTSPYERYLVPYHITTLPEETIRPIFDDAQWQVLQSHVSRFAGLGTTLQAQGIIESEVEEEQ